MTVTLQIYDELRSAVLYDLSDPTGTNSGLYGSVTTKLASDFDIGSPRLQSSTVDAQDIDATYSAFSKRATAKMKGKLIITGTSYDNLVTAVGTLSNYLSQGCVMKYVPGSTTYFLDVLPSYAGSVVAGGELAIYRAGALFQIDVELDLERQPYMRGAALAASTNYLSNGTLLRDSDGDGLPDNWVILTAATTSISAATQSQRCTTTATQRGIRQDTGAASAASGDVWTLSCEARLITGAAMLSLDFRSNTNTGLGTTSVSITSAGFQRYTVTATAPATTDHVRARVESNSGSTTTWDARNVQLEKASSASPFRVAAETVKLDPAGTGFAKMLPVYNPSTAPAPMTITTAFPDASTNVQAMDFFLATSDGVAGNKYLADYLNGPYYAQAEASGNGWTLTAGTDTTLAGAADATHSPGSGTTVARITHSTDPNQYNKRITFTRSTLLDSLRGKHRVLAAVKPASKKKYRLQLAWSAGAATTETNDEFLLDESRNLARVLCDLGTIDLPENSAVTLNALTLELWTRMGVGETASNLDVDYLMFVPQDNTGHVELSNATSTDFTTTQAPFVIMEGADGQVPKDLGAGDPTWVTGSTHGTDMRLNVVNEAVGIGSTTTGAFSGTTGGAHLVYFVANANNFIGTVNFEVANITDNDLLDINGNAMSQSFTYATATNVGWQVSVIVTEENADKYQPRVTVTSYTSGSVDVGVIAYAPITAIVQNQQIRTDPGSTGLDRYAAERLDSSGFYVAGLSADRVPFWIPPGLSLLWVEAYDVSVGGTELPHLNARTLTVTPTVYPRYWA